VGGCHFRDDGEAGVEVVQLDLVFCKAGDGEAGVDGAKNGRGGVEVWTFPD
jgi:hypothetical protein